MNTPSVLLLAARLGLCCCCAFARQGPAFTWDTLPIFFHGSNASGPPSNFDGPAPQARCDFSVIMMILLLVLAVVVSHVEALRLIPAHPRARAGRGSGRKACLRGNRSLQPALPPNMAEVQNDPAEIKLPPGSPGIELGFTSHVRASPL